MADKDNENIDATSTEEVDAKEAVSEESSPEERHLWKIQNSRSCT